MPTGGQARYAPGLGAYTFLRPQQVVEYDRAALAEVRRSIVALAESEALPRTRRGDRGALRIGGGAAAATGA